VCQQVSEKIISLKWCGHALSIVDVKLLHGEAYGGSESQQRGKMAVKKLSRLRYVIGIVVLVPLLIVLVSFGSGRIKTFRVISGSMEPTLLVGDYVFVAGKEYLPKRGEVVVFRNPDHPKELLVKRVIAVGGDAVQVKDGKIYVDSKLLKEAVALNLDDTKVKIDPEQFFVLGDNVNNSYDSFDFGPVSMSDVMGRANFIYWPLSRIGRVN
jgi:signal peptidase I